jgi:hypothetical protein
MIWAADTRSGGSGLMQADGGGARPAARRVAVVQGSGSGELARTRARWPGRRRELAGER